MTEIEKLIPQRSPIRMVDELLCVNEDESKTCLSIGHDNFFIDRDEHLNEAGVIEHIAQSASAVAGYKAIKGGATEPPVGFIGEVKKFHLYHRPKVGDKLITTITQVLELGNVSIVKGETKVDDEVYADTQLKIFMNS